MRKCKACGRDFASTDQTEEICYPCKQALKRLNGYAVEVVRCKDCKHYHPGTVYKEMKFCNRQKRGDNLPAHSRMQDDDFCSYGERRTDRTA